MIGYTKNETELTPIGGDILNFNQWTFQYPSGNELNGMLSARPFPSFKNKYLSRDSDYLKFSLDATDKGISNEGSNVRSELHSIKRRYYFNSSAEFSYTFKVDCTQPDIACYTVGQIMLGSDTDEETGVLVREKPILMIEIVKQRLIAYVKYYTISEDNTRYVQIDTTKEFDLGVMQAMTDVAIRIILSGKKLDIYRDTNHLVDTEYLSVQSGPHGCIFKLGLYYQTKATDKQITYLFTNVYIKNISLILE